MKKINQQKMLLINGGNNIDNFCGGFGAVAGVYTIGVLANWWNPIGWGGSVVGAIIGGSCAIYAVR